MAEDRVIKTTIELAGEGSYKDKLKQIEQGLRNVNSQQRVVDAQFAKGDKSLAALTTRLGTYQEKLKLQQARLAAVKTEYDRVVQAEGENSESARRLANEYNSVSAQVIKTEKAIAGMEMELGDTAKKMKSLLSVTENQKNALIQLGKEAEKASEKMSKTLTAVTTTAVAYSAKGFMEFGAEMSNVATLADTTAVSMDKLSRQALVASNATGVAATETAQGAYSALSSGVDTANAMSYITEAAKAAKAGQSDLNTVVNGSTSIMNAWKISYSDAASVFEKMLVAQDKGKTTLGEISSQIGQITGLAPQLNMSLDETLAAVAALTKGGAQTSSAITGLRAVLSNVLKPTAEATKTAAALGLEFNAAALQSKGLTGFLEDVVDKTGGSSEELAKLFGSVEGLSQIMLLGGSAADDYADALESMRNSAGKLDQAFETVTDNSAARLSMSLNKLKNNAIEFGQTLSPYIDMASGSLEKLSARISAMTAEEQKSLLQTALWTAAGLKAVSMLSKMAATVKLLGTAAGPAGLAAVAVTALVGAIAAANKAIENNSLDAAWARLDKAANANISGTMNASITATVDTSDAETKMLTAINSVYDNVAKKLTDGQTDTPEVVATLKQDIASLFAEAQGNLEGLGTEAGTYAEQLKALETETVAWVDGMAGKSTEHVQAHLGELEGIQQKVQELIEAMNEANASLRNENADAYKIAAGGATTNQETIARGVSWAYTNRELDMQEIREQAAADLAAADKAYQEGLQSAEEHLAKEQEISAWSEAELAKVEQTYSARMSQLFQGIVKAFESSEPETAQAFAEIGEKLNVVDIINEQLQGLANGTVDAAEAQKIISGIYDSIFYEGAYATVASPGAAGGQIVDMFTADVKAALENMSTEDLGLLDTINEIFATDAGKALNVDTTSMESVIKAAMSGVGGAGVDGMVEGLADPEGKVEKASVVMADDAIEAVKNGLQINSPSKVFVAIGQDTVQGFIDGANSKTAAVVAKFRTIARIAASAMRAELKINSPSKVFETIGGYTADGFINGINNKLDAVERTMQGMVNTDSIRTVNAQTPVRTTQSTGNTTVNVKYTGAFTQREARRFGREFAYQIAADNARKGG